jgi:hypothetical protein
MDQFPFQPCRPWSKSTATYARGLDRPAKGSSRAELANMRLPEKTTQLEIFMLVWEKSNSKITPTDSARSEQMRSAQCAYVGYWTGTMWVRRPGTPRDGAGSHGFNGCAVPAPKGRFQHGVCRAGGRPGHNLHHGNGILPQPPGRAEHTGGRPMDPDIFRDHRCTTPRVSPVKMMADSSTGSSANRIPTGYSE